jgi:putative ATPase
MKPPLNKAQMPFAYVDCTSILSVPRRKISFEVISPLLSRSRVFVLKPLSEEQIRMIIQRALTDKDRGIGSFNAELAEDALKYLVSMSNNDARISLNILEMAVLATPPDEDGKRNVSLSCVEDVLQHRALKYDQSGEQHYDIISPSKSPAAPTRMQPLIIWPVCWKPRTFFPARRLVRLPRGYRYGRPRVKCDGRPASHHFLGMKAV